MQIMDDVFFGAYGIIYKLPGATRGRILDEFSFEVFRGQITALIGPNGSGKSSLLKVVSGVTSLSKRECSGVVRFRGKNFLSFSALHRAQKVVYVGPELRAEFPVTAQEFVQLGRNCQGGQDVKRVEIAMRKCLCWELRDRFLDSLSGGERQLVSLARALAQEAQVLLLDEALSKMDLNHQAAMGALLKELAKERMSIILVSHDLNLASEWADQAILMKAGKKLFHGSIHKALTQENLRLLYPDTDFHLGSNPMTGAPKIFFKNADAQKKIDTPIV